jgi:hypothetical protein
MKKLKTYLSLLFVCFLTIQLYGQTDSVNSKLNHSAEVVKKKDNKEIDETINFRDKLAPEKGMTQEVHAKVEPTAISISIWLFMSWFFFLILISIPFYFNHKKIKGRQLIINNLVEKGKEIPKELMVHSFVPGRSDFHKGVILIALGIAIVIVLLSLKIENNYWTVGLIPLLIGVAYLVSFKFDKKNKMNSELD